MRTRTIHEGEDNCNKKLIWFFFGLLTSICKNCENEIDASVFTSTKEKQISKILCMKFGYYPDTNSTLKNHPY